MKKCLLSIALGLSAIAVQAQEWTLDQCVNYAIAHNLSIRTSELSVASAEQQVMDARSRYLPNLSAGAGQSWNLGRGLTAENTYANRNTSSFNWNASFNLPLFTGLSTERQVAYSRAALTQSLEEFEAAKDDLALNVMASYLQALYAKEVYAVAVQNLALSEYELEHQQALLDAGKIAEVTILEAKAQVANDELSVTTAANDARLALLDLSQLLQLESADGFDVAPLSDAGLLMPAEDVYTLALQRNHSIGAARKGITAADKNVALAKSGYLPTLSFNAGLGSSYYKLSGVPNEPFGDQMRHNYSTYFGFSLNIPIFDGFSTRNSVRRAHLQRANAELALDQAEQKLYREIQQAYLQASNASAKLESCLVAEEAANASLIAMQEKYNIGRATATEFEQAKNKALQATLQRIQATYERQLRQRILLFYAQGL